MSACCSHCSSSPLLYKLMSCWVILMCVLHEWVFVSLNIYLSLGLPHLHHWLFWKSYQNTNSCLSLQKLLKPRVQKQKYCRLGCWATVNIGWLIELLKSGSNVPTVEDDPVCMWLPCTRGFILHFSLEHLLFTLSLIAPALNVCNKCYPLLYFLCACIFCTIMTEFTSMYSIYMMKCIYFDSFWIFISC